MTKQGCSVEEIQALTKKFEDEFLYLEVPRDPALPKKKKTKTKAQKKFEKILKTQDAHKLRYYMQEFMEI